MSAGHVEMAEAMLRDEDYIEPVDDDEIEWETPSTPDEMMDMLKRMGLPSIA